MLYAGTIHAHAANCSYDSRAGWCLDYLKPLYPALSSRGDLDFSIESQALSLRSQIQNPPSVMMLAPQQLFGRGLRPPRVFGSPLRSVGGSGRERLYIESPDTNTMWPIRRRTLERHMPGLFQKMRESGNRRMNPLKLVASETLVDSDENLFILDLLMNGIAQPYPGPGAFFGFPSLTGGFNIHDQFQQLYATATQMLSNTLIEQILNTFGRISNILRHDFACGFGNDIYLAILNWAVEFMPFLGQLPGAIYSLIEHFYTMTDKDEDTLRRLLTMVPLQHQRDVIGTAQQKSTTEQSYLSINIIRLIQGLPLLYPT